MSHDMAELKGADVFEVNAFDGMALEREVAILSGRLASLLRQRFSQDNTAVNLSLQFLDFRYQSVFSDTPVEYWSIDSRERITETAKKAQGTCRLAQLIEQLDLSSLQVDVLLMAGLTEEHEGFSDIFRSLHPNGLPRPTLGLIAQLLEGHYQHRFEFKKSLYLKNGVDLPIFNLEEGQPFFTQSLYLLEGLWSWLQGIDKWPEKLAITEIPAVDIGLEDWLDEEKNKSVCRQLIEFRSQFLLFNSEHIETSINRATALCQHARINYCVIKVSTLAKHENPALTAKILLTHCLLRQVVPIFPLEVVSENDKKQIGFIEGIDFNRYELPVIFCNDTNHTYDHSYLKSYSKRPFYSLSIQALDSENIRKMWRSLLPELASEAKQLAARYPFEPHLIQSICHDVRNRYIDQSDSLPLLEDVALAVRSRSGNILAGGLELIRPEADWSQLILPEAQLSQLKDAASRLTLQSQVLDDWKFLKGKRGSRGVRMLFSGPPGTGKTLSAEVMAKALGVDLLQVDLSRVVSKWLGETEKNLSEIFNTAESTRAVLFFDEADSLFGKRTEVSDAHDRYANLETSYLLSRLEKYDGLAIMATNHRQNIDTAFSRRLEFIIEFEEPGVKERLKLWQCHIPESAPLDKNVNLSELAMLYPIVGGHIRNAAVTAAFLAAQEKQEIAHHHFMTAIKREYEKSGKAYREVSKR